MVEHCRKRKEEKVDEVRENDGVINEGGKKNRASSIIRYQQNILKNRASETGIEKHRDGITGERGGEKRNIYRIFYTIR